MKRLVVYMDRWDARRWKWTTREIAARDVEDEKELPILLARLREWGFKMPAEKEKSPE